MDSCGKWKIARISMVMPDRIEAKSMRTDLSDRNSWGDVYRFNSLNAYAFSYLDLNRTVLFKVVKIAENEHYFSKDPISQSDGEIVITLAPVAMIKSEGDKSIIQPGVVDLPMVGSDVFIFTAQNFAEILSPVFDSQLTIELGYINGFPKVRPSIDFGAIMSGHIAVLGNTGSGKSTTARLFISQVLRLFAMMPRKIKEGTTIIVFDVHGEYSVFDEQNESKFVKILRSEDFHVAAGSLDIEDWASILLPSDRVQKPLLERAVRYSALSDLAKKKICALLVRDALFSGAADSHGGRKIVMLKYLAAIRTELDPILKSVQDEKYTNLDLLIRDFKLDYGNIEDHVLDLFKRIIEEYLNKDGKQINKPEDVLLDKEFLLNSNSISLKRIRSALEFVFAEEEVKGNRMARNFSEGLVTQLNNLVERYDSTLFCCDQGDELFSTLDNCEGLIVIDLSSIFDDDALKIVSGFVARRFLEKQRRATNNERYPVYLWFDEAHRYVQSSTSDSGSIFERISREGRKFGCYLGVISQMPSELSRVVLSQTSTFIIHRIQNSLDLDFLVKNVPLVSQYQVSRFPVFPPGMAGIYSDRLPMPLEIFVDGVFKGATPPISPLIEG